MHHSIWKILFVLGANKYIERLEGKIRKCIFFMLKYSKITVWKQFPFVFINCRACIKNLDRHFAQNFTCVCYKPILMHWIFCPKYVYEEEKCDEIILGFCNFSVNFCFLANSGNEVIPWLESLGLQNPKRPNKRLNNPTRRRRRSFG